MENNIDQELEFKCCECWLIKPIDELKTFDNKNYCLECYKDSICKCCNCDTIDYKSDLHYVNDSHYCSDCFYDNYFYCSSCDNVFHIDDSNSVDDGLLCNECYENTNDGSLNEYEIPFKKIKSNSFKKIPFKRYCGCEIECLNNHLSNKQFNYDELRKFSFSQLSDGSLEENIGVEFSSLAFNGDVLYNNIISFCDELNKRNYRVDSSCGLHIHIQIKKTLDNIKKILLFYSKYEEFFYKMMPKSRQHNNYCLKVNSVISSDKFNAMLNADTIEKFKLLFYEIYSMKSLKRITKEKYNQKRYLWFNLHSIFLRKTLEIRLHNGTIDKNKILNWFMINLTILDFIEKLNIETIKLLPKNEEFFLSLFDADLKKYIIDRYNKFKSDIGDNN